MWWIFLIRWGRLRFERFSSLDRRSATNSLTRVDFCVRIPGESSASCSASTSTALHWPMWRKACQVGSGEISALLLRNREHIDTKQGSLAGEYRKLWWTLSQSRREPSKVLIKFSLGFTISQYISYNVLLCWMVGNACDTVWLFFVLTWNRKYRRWLAQSRS